MDMNLIAKLPCLVAECNAVYPLSSIELMFAPLLISNSITPLWPV